MGVSTDFIVGFPGESESDFRDTIRLIEQVGYDGLYIFKYSERPGTPAARLEDDVSKDEKGRRFMELEETHRKFQRRIYQEYVGRSIQVLAEQVSAKSEQDMTGHSTCHKVVNFPRAWVRPGDLASVRITKAKRNSLYGEVLSAA